VFFKKYKERKKADKLEQERLVAEEYCMNRERSERISVLKKELGITARKADGEFFEELFTILKTMKDRLDSLEEK
jgi:hypothetical protein